MNADEIFKEFKEQSVSEFFRKNSQMLGYSGKVRSLTTAVHEYVTNSLDACEEAGVLPDIMVKVTQVDEAKYTVTVRDNGPGIPEKLVGSALAKVLSGTKFHRYIQQRGQQGIGAAGCTLFSRMTTGKPIHVHSGTERQSYTCDVTIEIKTNKPIVENLEKLSDGFRGLEITAELGEVKYEKSDHGVYEYIKRTALSNPHVSITLIEPDGKEAFFPRSYEEIPKRPKQIKPHPLGVQVNDIVDFAHFSVERTVASFLSETFARVTRSKVEELGQLVPGIDLKKSPKDLSWAEAEEIVKAFGKIKWMAPELDSLSTIGRAQIEATIKNILNPTFVAVVERRPSVFRGGIPFVVEAGIAYGGDAGKASEEGMHSSVIRFANKVPLLFDGSACAITEAVNTIQWRRYGISDFEEQPLSVMVNVSSVYIPYSGVGKQAISHEDEIIGEIRLALMACAKDIERYVRGERAKSLQESRYNMIMRYVGQLASDISEISGKDRGEIEMSLRRLIDTKYSRLFEANAEQDEAADGSEGSAAEEAQDE